MSDIGSTYFEDPRFNGREGFGASVADYISDFADRRRRVRGIGTAGQQKKIEILERLADHVAELDEIRDRRLMVLGAVNSIFVDLRRVRVDAGTVPSDEVGTTAGKFDKPSPLQSWLLEVLGDPAHPAPSPDQTVDDLAAAGVRDLVEVLRDFTHGARTENEALLADVQSLTKHLTQARQEADSVAGLRAANEELTQDLASKEKLIEEQQTVIASLEPTRPPRRKMIEPAIYRTASRGLEVLKPGGGYVKADSLGAARLLRDELREGASGDSEDPAEGLEAALDAREKELGRELTEQEIEAIHAEFQSSSATAAGGED